MFRDLPPHLRFDEPTRAEEDAAEEQYWHDHAAQVGGQCFDLTDELQRLLDKAHDEWRAEDQATLDCLLGTLTTALELAKRLTRRLGRPMSAHTDALGDLAGVNRALALLTRAATRADNLLAMADGYTTIPHSYVRADARVIKEAMDEARKALVKENAQ